MLRYRSRILLFPMLTLAILFGSNSVVVAQSQASRSAEQIQLIASPTPRQHSPIAELKLRSQDSTSLGQKLTKGKLRSCQNRAEAISRSSSSAVANVDKLIEKLDSISTKVQNFQIANDITLENEAFVLSDLASQKQASLDALTAAESAAKVFNCESDSPKNQLRQFIVAMDEAREALHSYKAAVHAYAGLVRQGDFVPLPDGSQ